MFYRVIGVATGLATIGFLGAVVLTAVSPSLSRENTGFLAMAAAVIAVGLLTMIWHLNLRQTSESVRREWRSYLTYLGPLAASVYLVQVAPSTPAAGLSTRHFPKLLLMTGLALVGFVVTLLAALNVGPVGALPPGEAFTNYVLRLGGLLAVAAIGALFGLHYWRSILWMLIPSFLAMYAGVRGETEIAIGILGAGFILTWIVATGFSRIVAR